VHFSTIIESAKKAVAGTKLTIKHRFKPAAFVGNRVFYWLLFIAKRSNEDADPRTAEEKV